MNKYLLKLFISGQTSRSERAISNLLRICEERVNGECELIIIDILERPQLAEDEKILVTPMLIKQLPPPARRIIGDLSNIEHVMRELDLPWQAVSKQ
ncbi:MAG TPA: circadian clock KaiB family protein [Blastocatellia bacterium]|nr:circadian clock KaiB family protein [Blastocatellia bacterium]